VWDGVTLSPSIIRAAIRIQSVTRGHFSRRLVHLRISSFLEIQSDSDESHISLTDISPTDAEAESDVYSVGSSAAFDSNLSLAEHEFAVQTPRFSVLDLRSAVCGPRINRAAIRIQSVTRGHFSRRLVHLRISSFLEIQSDSDESHISLTDISPTDAEAESDVYSVGSSAAFDSNLSLAEHEFAVQTPRFSVLDLRSAVCGPRINRAAIRIQSVTRGHFSRRLVHLRISSFLEIQSDSSRKISYISN